MAAWNVQQPQDVSLPVGKLSCLFRLLGEAWRVEEPTLSEAPGHPKRAAELVQQQLKENGKQLKNDVTTAMEE